MDVLSFSLDILKSVIAGALLIGIAYLVFKSKIEDWQRIQILNYNKALNKDLLPLKLQAYERMTLFIERINPSNMLLRIHAPGMSARQMQLQALEEVRAEYQHNLAQQLYIGDAWKIISRVKEDTITLINRAAESLPEGASAVDLSRVVFRQLEAIEENPYQLALMVIKSELQEL